MNSTLCEGRDASGDVCDTCEYDETGNGVVGDSGVVGNDLTSIFGDTSASDSNSAR